MKKTVVATLFCLAASSVFAADGAALYNKCKACHGAKAEKSFMNKVPALSTLAKDDIVASLKGYKDGSVNKFKMAAQMKNVVKNLSDDDINAIADYITTLK